MKKLVGFAVVALLVVGIVKVVHGRTKESRAHAACEQLIDKCGPLMEADGISIGKSDIDECANDFATKGVKELGDNYDKLTSCMADADSCGEEIGCFAGTGLNMLEDEMHGFGKGFSKTVRH